jgi:hypothetical protein
MRFSRSTLPVRRSSLITQPSEPPSIAMSAVAAEAHTACGRCHGCGSVAHNIPGGFGASAVPVGFFAGPEQATHSRTMTSFTHPLYSLS